MDKLKFMQAVFGDLREYPTLPADEEIDAALATLQKEEGYVIRARFSDPFPCYAEIGKTYPYRCRPMGRDYGIGVSGERIHQILARALRRLRHPSRRGFLLKELKHA